MGPLVSREREIWGKCKPNCQHMLLAGEYKRGAVRPFVKLLWFLLLLSSLPCCLIFAVSSWSIVTRLCYLTVMTHWRERWSRGDCRRRVPTQCFGSRRVLYDNAATAGRPLSPPVYRRRSLVVENGAEIFNKANPCSTVAPAGRRVMETAGNVEPLTVF